MRERVVALLREMADAMRRTGDRTRFRAYSRAADNLERRADFDALWARGALRSVTGVGVSIERTIRAFVERGERPAWLDDASLRPRKIRGSRVERAGDDGTLRVLEDVPLSYFDAPFADAPDLHVHTTWSDGTLDLEAVVAWARQLRAPAVGITDHSASLRIAHGLRPEEVRDQWREMERLQVEYPDVRILRGTECDILRDGRLDHPDELLAEFDFVVGSLHSQLRLAKRAQTERVLTALDHPSLTVLGHPTTRIPDRRPRAELDLDRVFERAAERGVGVEVNGNPGRLDLDVALARRALRAGCRLSCASDGHSAREMLSFATARSMAAEAGATARDLVNYDFTAAARTRPTGRAAT